MQEVSLDRSNHFTISLEGYEKIKEIIRQFAVCCHCGQYYNIEIRPNVAGNACLECFMLSAEKRHGLKYIKGQEETNTYLFINPNGVIYYSRPGPNYSDSCTS